MLEMPWDLRGPTDGRQFFMGQQFRKNTGRYANRGGFAKRVKKIWRESGQDWWFSLRNPHGPCSMHLHAALGILENAVTTALSK